MCPSDFETYSRLSPKPEFDNLFKQAIRMAFDTSISGRPNESVKYISCPTLIVRGETDPIVANSNLVELSNQVKNVRILDIPSAGHEAFKDQHEIFTNHLKQFLSCP